MGLTTKFQYDPKPGEKLIEFHVPRSGQKLWHSRHPFPVYYGPAGTGKTRIWCEFLHYLCITFPGVRLLMARQYRSTMGNSCMKTMNREVLREADKVRFNSTQQAWIYPMRKAISGPFKGDLAQSEIVVSGLDEPAKVMSSQYDGIYINEITDIKRDQFEYLISRARNGVLPWQFVGGDCNPVFPSHWVKRGIDLKPHEQGYLYGIRAELKENPVLWDDELEDWTERGRDYVFVRLGALTGVRRARLLEGKWVAAEGQIYDTFDRGVHVIPAFPVPVSWRRIWSVDFGFVNPFVWQNWAVDPEGRMYLTQEIYITKTLVSRAAEMILEATAGQPWPEAIICDHDREDRATLEWTLNIPTQNAYKDVARGIQAVKKRYDPVFDGVNVVDGKDLGRPMIFFFDVNDQGNALVHPPDPELVREGKPVCTIDEEEAYVWDPKAQEKQKGDIPVKLNDHGQDAKKYAVAYEDNLADLLEDEMNDTILVGESSEYRISDF